MSNGQSGVEPDFVHLALFIPIDSSDNLIPFIEQGIAAQTSFGFEQQEGRFPTCDTYVATFSFSPRGFYDNALTGLKVRDEFIG